MLVILVWGKSTFREIASIAMLVFRACQNVGQATWYSDRFFVVHKSQNIFIADFIKKENGSIFW